MNKYYYSDGSVLDYRDFNRTLHRTDEPAIEHPGVKLWYQNGKLHRLGAPAVKYCNGDKQWYQNGLRHRLDGPAIKWGDGSRFWFQDGLRHRLDGPAIEHANGKKQWFIKGRELTKEEFEKHTLIMKLSGLLDE